MSETCRACRGKIKPKNCLLKKSDADFEISVLHVASEVISGKIEKNEVQTCIVDEVDGVLGELMRLHLEKLNLDTRGKK